MPNYLISTTPDSVPTPIGSVFIRADFGSLRVSNVLTDLSSASGQLIEEGYTGSIDSTGIIYAVATDARGARFNISAIASGSVSSEPSTLIMADAAEYLTTIRYLLESFVEPTTGRLRVMLDPNGGSQTLGTLTTVGTVTTVTGVTTVGTVTNMSQVGAIPANGMVFDAMLSAWALAVRGNGIIS